MIDKEDPVLPQGWTYLIHGSSMNRWDSSVVGKDFIVGDSGGENGLRSFALSAIAREDALKDQKRGFNTTQGYAGKDGAFQIRVLFFKDPRYGDTSASVTSQVNAEELKEINRYYGFQGGRHPAVPNKTKLIALGETSFDEITQTDGQRIFWYIPEKFMGHYQQQISKQVKRHMFKTYEEAKGYEQENVLPAYDTYAKEGTSKSLQGYLSAVSSFAQQWSAQTVPHDIMMSQAGTLRGMIENPHVAKAFSLQDNNDIRKTFKDLADRGSPHAQIGYANMLFQQGRLEGNKDKLAESESYRQKFSKNPIAEENFRKAYPENYASLDTEAESYILSDFIAVQTMMTKHLENGTPLNTPYLLQVFEIHDIPVRRGKAPTDDLYELEMQALADKTSDFLRQDEDNTLSSTIERSGRNIHPVLQSVVELSQRSDGFRGERIRTNLESVKSGLYGEKSFELKMDRIMRLEANNDKYHMSKLRGTEKPEQKPLQKEKKLELDNDVRKSRAKELMETLFGEKKKSL